MREFGSCCLGDKSEPDQHMSESLSKRERGREAGRDGESELETEGVCAVNVSTLRRGSGLVACGHMCILY